MRRLLIRGMVMLAVAGCGGCADPSASVPTVRPSTAARPSATSVAASPVRPSSVAKSTTTAVAAGPSAGVTASPSVCVPCGGTEVMAQIQDNGYLAPQWRTFEAADGSFTLDAPAPITDEDRVAEDGTRMRGGRVNVSGVNYVVAYSAPPDPRGFLQQSAASLTALYGASAQRGPAIGGVPSKLMTYALKGGLQARHLLWSDGRMLLQLIVVSRAGAPTEAERFQNSVTMRR